MLTEHERAEQEELYPAMDRLLGSRHATETMSRAHAEIAHQTRRLGQLIEDIGPGEPDATDVADLRALLYGLHAILSLHTTQEEENYLSLGDDLMRLFTTALNEMRARYLITFTPRVTTAGWHELKVRVRGRSVDIKARPGYFVNAAR